MSTSILSSISARVEKAAGTLKVTTDEILKVLETNGIENNDEGLKYLNSRLVTLEMLQQFLFDGFKDRPLVKLTAAATYLKGEDPFAEEIPDKKPEPVAQETPQPTTSSIIELIQTSKPIGNLRDDELLILWSKNRDVSYETELSKRAKGQAFIVLKPGKHIPGQEDIDISLSLELLKSARRRINPTIVPYAGNTFQSVYKISELNINDRIIETCPICGEILWKGYCSSCDSNFAGIGDEERAYIKLIIDSGKINPKTASDRKAVLVSAAKGLNDLSVTWPSIMKNFEELKATGNLPKLRRIADRPSTAPADPFHVHGNRTF